MDDRRYRKILQQAKKLRLHDLLIDPNQETFSPMIKIRSGAEKKSDNF